jgi:octaprenyl-diphosphate synthase
MWEFNFVFRQNAQDTFIVTRRHHHTARQNAYGAFKHAHIYVQLKDRYTRIIKDGSHESRECYVIGSHQFLHKNRVKRGAPECTDILQGRNESVMSLDEISIKPHDALAAYLAADMEAVNVLIRERMASEHAPRIPEVTAHLVEAGGKRLRPMLTLAAAHLCGYGGPYHVHLAATVEFIHTATLLHDDVVDESGQRRGRPTANLLWDNKSSVLVGDYLFSRSFQLMVETGSLRVLDILANASATIAEGEVLQLTASQDLATTEAIYLQVVRGKTAALFSAATEVGGVIAGADDAQVQALFDYGDALGIAFQIVDDLLDMSGDQNAIGKNVGDDFREKKLTLPLIKAIAKANAEERAFWVRTIEKGRQEDGDLEHAIALLHKHGALEDTRLEALAWADKAVAAIDQLPKHPVRDMLREIAGYVVARIN